MENPTPNTYVILHGENTTVFCVQCDEEYLLPVTTEQSFDGKRENSLERDAGAATS
jgi:hypothetical protein